MYVRFSCVLHSFRFFFRPVRLVLLFRQKWRRVVSISMVDIMKWIICYLGIHTVYTHIHTYIDGALRSTHTTAAMEKQNNRKNTQPNTKCQTDFFFHYSFCVGLRTAVSSIHRIVSVEHGRTSTYSIIMHEYVQCSCVLCLYLWHNPRGNLLQLSNARTEQPISSFPPRR